GPAIVAVARGGRRAAYGKRAPRPALVHIDVELVRQFFTLDRTALILVPRGDTRPGRAQLALAQPTVVVRIEQAEQASAMIGNSEHRRAGNRLAQQIEISRQLGKRQLPIAVAVSRWKQLPQSCLVGLLSINEPALKLAIRGLKLVQQDLACRLVAGRLPAF